MFYFAAYAVYSMVIGIFRIVFVFWDKDEKVMERVFCDSFEGAIQADQRDWKDTEFTDMNDCMDQVGFAMRRDEFIALVIMLLFQLHFALVLYQHYKNANLTKSRGGCLPDTDIQLGSAPGMHSASSHARVGHAVDDSTLEQTARMSQMTV